MVTIVRRILVRLILNVTPITVSLNIFIFQLFENFLSYFWKPRQKCFFHEYLDFYVFFHSKYDYETSEITKKKGEHKNQNFESIISYVLVLRTLVFFIERNIE